MSKKVSNKVKWKRIVYFILFLIFGVILLIQIGLVQNINEIANLLKLLVDTFLQQLSFLYISIFRILTLAITLMFLVLAIKDKMKPINRFGIIGGMLMGSIVGMVVGSALGVVLASIVGLVAGMVLGLIGGLIGGMVLGFINEFT